MAQGRFIVLEGIDGCGKGTQASLLASRLKKAGRKVVATAEPTNNLVGGLIRGGLTGEWKPTNQVIQLLYAADRGHHLQREVIPALAAGYDVVCDRYYYSSIAFGSLNADTAWLEELNKYYQKPDIALYLKVSPETSVARMDAGRLSKDMFEHEEKLVAVATVYDGLGASHPELITVDGEGSVEEVHERIWEAISAVEAR